jgi:hypothetical protein
MPIETVYPLFILVGRNCGTPHTFSFVQDTVFSCAVTALFLRPIYSVLRGGKDNNLTLQSAAYKSLLKTKWMTLGGVTLAVVSSTVLYVNLLLYFILGGFGKPFFTNPYLNIWVFGMNMDSVLNDVAVLLACGLLKAFSCQSLTSSRTSSKKDSVIHILPQFGSEAS